MNPDIQSLLFGKVMRDIFPAFNIQNGNLNGIILAFSSLLIGMCVSLFEVSGLSVV